MAEPTTVAVERIACRHPIRPGDRIGYSEAGWLCTDCTKAGGR